MTAVQGEPLPAKEGRGWTADDGSFGARLALIRQRMQWNIKEAARECGIPGASWASWEAGALPRRYTEMCHLIANRTGADVVWLMDGPRVVRDSEPNVRLDDPTRTALPRQPNGRTSPHTTNGLSPSAPQRRDHTRPPSAVPVTRRRPVSVRPPARPMVA